MDAPARRGEAAAMVIVAGEGEARGGGGGGGEGTAKDGVAHVVIDIAGDAEAAATKQHQLGVCRICQLEDGDVDERVSGRLMRLGCGCRGELAVAHRRCAEAWFTIRGDRKCEICGKNAENIHGGVGAQKFMRQWHETTAMDGGGSSVCCFSKTQSCCNLLIGCLMIMFILPWLQHDHIL